MVSKYLMFFTTENVLFYIPRTELLLLKFKINLTSLICRFNHVYLNIDIQNVQDKLSWMI